MSTISKLGGKEHREGKKRRKRAIGELARMAQMYQPGTPQRFRVESRLEALRDTQRASHMTDAQKDESFRAILNRGI